MKGNLLLGTLLPAHADFLPIMQAIRDKYKLPEINPDDGPIEVIYLGDENIILEEFLKDIENLVHENLTILPPDTIMLYTSY